MTVLSLELSDELLERVAERVAELLPDKAAAGPEPWLNVEQAAAHLGISTSQVYSLCVARRSNAFPVTKEGSRSYFKASALDAWRER